MKKVLIFLVLMVALIFGGCSSSNSSAAPSATPHTSAPPTAAVPAQPPTSNTPTSSAPASLTASVSPITSTPTNVITLKYADQNPEKGYMVVNGTQPWLNQITTATKGQVQFETYYSQSLCKGPDTWNAVKNRVADMGWMFPGYWAGMMPLGDVMELPFLAFSSDKQASGIFWQLYEKYPSLADEYKENHVLVGWSAIPFFLVTTKKQVKTPEDIKGLKIRVPAGPPTDEMKALGAVPMTVGMPDTYLDLQKGVIDGMGVNWSALLSFKQYEVVKYYTYLPLFTNYFLEAMNNDTWNSLPPNVQQEIDSVSNLQGSLWLGSHWTAPTDVGRPIIQKQGYPMVEYTPSADDIGKWSAIAGKPVWDEWVKKMNSEGHTDAQDILNTTLNLINTYHP